jgi:hypothetical protein
MGFPNSIVRIILLYHDRGHLQTTSLELPKLTLWVTGIFLLLDLVSGGTKWRMSRVSWQFVVQTDESQTGFRRDCLAFAVGQLNVVVDQNHSNFLNKCINLDIRFYHHGELDLPRLAFLDRTADSLLCFTTEVEVLFHLHVLCKHLHGGAQRE